MHAYTYEAGLLSDTYVLCNMKLVYHYYYAIEMRIHTVI